jgi:hypothetical protein
MAAKILKIIRRKKNPIPGGGDKYSRTHHILRSGDSILVFDQPLP